MQNYILYFFFLLLSANVSAQSYSTMKDSKSFQNKLREVAKNTQSLQSDFVQVKHLDVLSEDIESEGKLYYKNENLLRWEYTTPIQYLIVMKNGKLSIKDNGKVSSFDLSGNKTFQKVNEMVVRSLQGDLVLDELEYSYQFKENSSNYLVIMTPKEKKVQEFMKSISIYFSKKNYAVSEVKMQEQSGDYTIMKFKNKKINASISDKIFSIN